MNVMNRSQMKVKRKGGSGTVRGSETCFECRNAKYLKDAAQLWCTMSDSEEIAPDGDHSTCPGFESGGWQVDDS